MKLLRFLTAVLAVFLLAGCSAGQEPEAETYNLLVEFTGDTGAYSLGLEEEGHGGGAINADNSEIRGGQSFGFTVSGRAELRVLDKEENVLLTYTLPRAPKQDELFILRIDSDLEARLYTPEEG